MLKHALMSSAHRLTDITNTISVKATSLSKLMDTSEGGTIVHGGFHRIFGGHDFWNQEFWAHHGLEYPKELLKDFITPNGLPLPGAKEAIEKLGVSVQTAQDWGCLNIGELLGGSISIADSTMKMKRTLEGKDPEEIHHKEILLLLLKGTVATTTSNPLMAGSALIDASILMKRIYNEQFNDLFNYCPSAYEDC